MSTTAKIYKILVHLEDHFDLANVTTRKVTYELCEKIHKFLARRLVRILYNFNNVSNPCHKDMLFIAVMTWSDLAVVLGGQRGQHVKSSKIMK